MISSQPNGSLTDPSSSLSPGSPTAGLVSRREHWAAVYELTKPRITRMVAITAGVGFVLAAVGARSIHWTLGELLIRGVGCMIGTALSASGANALNMWWERVRDGQMPRTAKRPLPTHRVAPMLALWVGLALAVVGVAVLAATTGAAAALVSGVTVAIYVLAYTPLKPMTTLNTLVGAVPGALPPMIGWAAALAGSTNGSPYGQWATLADPRVAMGGWMLFLLMFVWQIPHVLALAWMFKDDYAQGGYRMLPIADPDGRRTASTMLLWSITLVPVSMAVPMLLRDRLSMFSAAVALVTGLVYVGLCVRVVRERTRQRARDVFVASVIHLPILLIVLVADALLGLILRGSAT